MIWFSIDTIYIKWFPGIHNQIFGWNTVNRYSSPILLHCIFFSNMWDYSYKIIMIPKRLSFSNPLVDFFTTKEQEVRFFQSFSNRSLVRIRTLDPEDFKECKFFKTFEELNLSSFLYMPLKMIYPSLVRMFLSNLRINDGILRREVKSHRITLSI